MELWIRSQDKNILCEAIHFELSSSGLSILGQNKVYYGVVLGTYKSKERALEVLDEIQSRLMPYSEIIQDTEGITISYKNVSVIIYEMPKE